jgi:hypothetical protein
MARPTKQGIDYFPLDVEFDDKHQLYLIDKGATGLGVLVAIWQIIYSNGGYYILANSDLPLLVKKRVSVDINEVNACINSMIERGVFDKNLHDQFGILTSRGIQKRFFEAAKRKKEVVYNSDFVLIDVSAYKNLVNVNINPVNVNKNATNVKVKVNVKEEVKGEVYEQELIPTKTPTPKPTPKLVQEYFFSKGYPLEEAEKFFNHFEAQDWVTGSGVPITNWRVKAENWHKEESYKILEKKNGSTGKNIGATGDDLRDIINQRAQREVIDSDAPL